MKPQLIRFASNYVFLQVFGWIIAKDGPVPGIDPYGPITIAAQAVGLTIFQSLTERRETTIVQE
ncbi:hypothetical protein G8759_13060 [Spirosoma aureum]|uniref:Uncharacterized protein n=1 Tax=Spirosoma aureum TaxID=2692134 RepID=A0A6G9AMC3_9BACT|nr:hypothetical protein [Spirosoma aureum]QIP13489.1 hypothetical protein G8759_13060 [Spirosoma aureum]